jgi:hypothetical protein
MRTWVRLAAEKGVELDPSELEDRRNHPNFLAAELRPDYIRSSEEGDCQPGDRPAVNHRANSLRAVNRPDLPGLKGF